MATLFDEILLDPDLFTVGDAVGSPEFANALTRSPGTGLVAVAIIRHDPQHVWSVDFKMVSPSTGSFSGEMDYFNNIWYGGSGSAYGFRVRIEWDHIANLEVLGTSDGTVGSRTWKLTRTYNRPGTTTHPHIRYICKPVVSARLSGDSVTLYEPNGVTPRAIEVAFKVYDNGVETVDYTISNTTGILVLGYTPTTGHIITWSGQFDTPCQFFQNSFQAKNDFPAEIKGLTIIEIMPISLGLE